MACSCFSCYCVGPEYQVILTDNLFGTREIHDGPIACTFFNPCTSSLRTSKKVLLNENQYCLVVNEKADKSDYDGDGASVTRYEFGPQLVALTSPWEHFEAVQNCTVLDQDDYLVIADRKGYKRTVRGPRVHRIEYGDTVEKKAASLQIPVNYYIIVENANNKDHPFEHIRGPLKFYPSPFQTVMSAKKNTNTGGPMNTNNNKQKQKWKKDKNGKWQLAQESSLEQFEVSSLSGKGSEYYNACIEITTARAVHILRASGTVELIDTPQFYMPAVGESIHAYVDRIVLLKTDFCIIISNEGAIRLMHGENEEQRSFFPKPFYEFVTFICDKEETIMSTLPTFISHQFDVRTSDKVVLNLDLRISYQITEVEQFASNPLEHFYAYIRNNVQSKLVERFSSQTLRQFMNTFSEVAQTVVDVCGEFFKDYGITILDVQILNFTCTEAETRRLLQRDIEIAVTKQNELRATQRDLEIQELRNDLNRRKKDLEVEMSKRDNEVILEAKQVENEMRMKEMTIEIEEEKKKTDLLEHRRGNELVEAEFSGKATGHEFHEFCKGIDENLTGEQKVAIWCRTKDLEQAKVIYAKLTSVNMYPPDADMGIYNFGAGGGASELLSGHESIGNEAAEAIRVGTGQKSKKK